MCAVAFLLSPALGSGGKKIRSSRPAQAIQDTVSNNKPWHVTVILALGRLREEDCSVVSLWLELEGICSESPPALL